MTTSSLKLVIFRREFQGKGICGAYYWHSRIVFSSNVIVTNKNMKLRLMLADRRIWRMKSIMRRLAFVVLS